MKHLSIASLLLSVISIGLITFHILSTSVSTADDIREAVNIELDNREQALVAKYRPRLQDVQTAFEVKPTNPQNLEELIDGLIQIVVK